MRLSWNLFNRFWRQYDDIYFFNFGHKGDVHVSREFVKYIIKQFPDKQYFYVHENHNGRLLLDIPLLSFKPFDNFDFLNKYKGFYVCNKAVYINTWYCSYNKKVFHGTTLHTLYDVFRYTLKKLGSNLEDDISFFIPSINFDYFDIKNIRDFMLHNNKVKVLVCDNQVLSGQSRNFDFEPILEYLAQKYTDVVFISSNSNRSRNNIIDISKIIGFPVNNLNECAYVSRFCDIIVGRGSGPFTFSLLKDNVYDKNKAFIYFTSESSAGDAGISFIVKDNGASFIHSNSYDYDTVVGVISNEIHKVLRKR